jgi:hypothetical protein
VSENAAEKLAALLEQMAEVHRAGIAWGEQPPLEWDD